MLDVCDDRGEGEVVGEGDEGYDTLSGLVGVVIWVLGELEAEGVVAGLGTTASKDEVAEAASEVGGSDASAELRE